MRIELRQSKRNMQWRVYFIGKNNKVLMTSEQYHNLGDAEKAVKIIQAFAGETEIIYKHARG